MNLLILTSIILSVILGVGRMVDLALFTDAETGLCVVGSVWLRYAALAVAILLAVAAGRAAKPEARKLCSPCKPSGVMAVLGAGFMAATFVAKLALWDSSVVGRIIMAFLSLSCSAWLLALGRSWMGKSWKRPSDDLTHVVLGTAVFYWCVLARFMENSSSWHRVAPTAAVWQALAALVCLLEQPCPGAVPAKARKTAAPCAPAGLAALCAVPVLGAAPCSWIPGGRSSGRTGPAAGAVCFATGTVLRGSAGRRSAPQPAHWPVRSPNENTARFSVGCNCPKRCRGKFDKIVQKQKSDGFTLLIFWQST